MKNLFFLATLALAISCSTAHKPGYRKVASHEKNLTGTYLAVADYKSGHKGPNKAAVRIYFAEVEGEVDKYHVVLAEYVDLLKMAPSYVASNKLPIVAKTFGFLKNITSNISTYEAIPGEKENTFELWPLIVVGDSIEVNKAAKPRILTLSKSENAKNALEGATISSVRADEPKEIFFPMKDDEKRNGIQYGTAKLAYEKVKLESTWRKEFLRGPYLSQYYRKDDVVLKLSGSNDKLIADFVINENMSRMPQKKRAKMFTSEKSAFLKGEFSVTEPRDGMFLVQPLNADEATKEILKGRIGLFIDIFDATKSLNQDVVELVFIDPNQPDDFLMYYEHPENGEGKYLAK